LNPRPVTLLTGFLGSGKTTLLNALLRCPELAGTAVVVNEFGEVGIDHLLVERGVDNVLLLAGGCLCCTVTTTLGDTLTELLGKEARGEVPAFVRVVVETTGLADPGPILRQLWSDAFLRRQFPLDGIVVTVDALHALDQLARQREARRQVAVADRIVLTKVDLAGEAARAEVEAVLAAINPAAPVVAAVRGEVDSALLTGIAPAGPVDVAAGPGGAGAGGESAPRPPIGAAGPGGESAPGAPAVAAAAAVAAVAAEARRARVDAWLAAEIRREFPGGRRAGGARGGAPHDGRFVSAGFDLTGTVTWAALAAWMDRVREVCGEGLLRCKGVVAVEGEAKPVVIHGVLKTFHPPERLDAWPAGERATRIVVIGEGIDRAAVARTVDELTGRAGGGGADSGT
jgi:G3E family GTPase